MNSVTTAEAGMASSSFSGDDRERMHVLVKKAKAAELDEVEQIELRNFQKAGRTLELKKARARIAVQQTAA